MHQHRWLAPEIEHPWIDPHILQVRLKGFLRVKGVSAQLEPLELFFSSGLMASICRARERDLELRKGFLGFVGIIPKLLNNAPLVDC
jgi:hypothetical protein